MTFERCWGGATTVRPTTECMYVASSTWMKKTTRRLRSISPGNAIAKENKTYISTDRHRVVIHCLKSIDFLSRCRLQTQIIDTFSMDRTGGPISALLIPSARQNNSWNDRAIVNILYSMKPSIYLEWLVYFRQKSNPSKFLRKVILVKVRIMRVIQILSDCDCGGGWIVYFTFLFWKVTCMAHSTKGEKERNKFEVSWPKSSVIDNYYLCLPRPPPPPLWRLCVLLARCTCVSRQGIFLKWKAWL